LPRYRVFIAYGGRQGPTVARFVDECLYKNGIEPCIALPGAIGEIRCGSQEEIFEEEGRCDALVAVNTSYARRSLKFRDEVEKARYGFKIPVVAFIQNGCQPLHLLSVGVTRVDFDQRQYRRKCGELIHKLLNDIEYSSPAFRSGEGEEVPERVLHG